VARRPIDIALLFEKAVRELDVACALKVLLERQGLSVEIIQQNHPAPHVLRDLMPSVVVLPFCYQARSNNRFLVTWRDAAFFNLTWEQLFYPGNATAKTPRGEFAVQHVIHNAWSEMYAGLLRARGVPEQNIFVSGNPAFTLYQSPYNTYFRSRGELAAEHELDPSVTWVFFPENFNWAFYEEPMLAQMVADGQGADQVADMRQAVTHSFEETMRWCKALVEQTGVHVIVRPRPATPVEEFRRRVNAVIGETPDRLRILQVDTVRDWILASDVVASSYSTSLIEASIAGRPAYIVEPSGRPEALRQDWHDMIPRLRTFEALVDVVVGPQSQVGNNPLAQWARRNLMANGDSILAIADRIAAIRRREVPVPRPAPWRSLVAAGRYGLPPRLTMELRRRFPGIRVPTRRRIAAELRGDVAAAAEVPARVRRWRQVLEGYPP
jgi:surface carbohydrate biosynthesis protein